MHNKKIIIITFIITLLIMAGGYAVYSSSLKVEGTGSIDSNFNIEVTGIKEESKEGKAVSVTEPTYTSSTATFNTKLQRPGDNIEYKVEITNNGTIDGKINSLTITNPSTVAKVETRGIVEGEVIKAGEVKNYIVRIYIEENAKLTEDLTSQIEVSAEIIQDDNQIFNEGIDGTVENKLAIESTKEESDYTSIKATVTAKGNGLKYSYSLDNNTWTEASISNTYTFSGLNPNERYTVYYKVEDENNNYVTDSKWINTKNIEEPTYSIDIEGWSTQKVVTITYPEVEGATYEYKVNDGEWQTATNLQKVIFTENSTIIARVNIGGVYQNSSTYTVDKIDNETPALTLSTSSTTNSITVVANANALSGITKYEYSIDGSTWIDNTTYNNYTFKGLTHNIDYTVHSRVTSKTGKTTSLSENIKTNLIETPTFSEDGTIVTITFMEECGESLTCTYMKDNGEEVEVTDSTADVEFTNNGTLIAKITDGTNYITSSTYTFLVTAQMLYYDNTNTGLDCDNVQCALDEISKEFK